METQSQDQRYPFCPRSELTRQEQQAVFRFPAGDSAFNKGREILARAYSIDGIAPIETLDRGIITKAGQILGALPEGRIPKSSAGEIHPLWIRMEAMLLAQVEGEPRETWHLDVRPEEALRKSESLEMLLFDSGVFAALREEGKQE